MSESIVTLAAARRSVAVASTRGEVGGVERRARSLRALTAPARGEPGGVGRHARLLRAPIAPARGEPDGVRRHPRLLRALIAQARREPDGVGRHARLLRAFIARPRGDAAGARPYASHRVRALVAGTRGQASVELVGLLPLVAVIALAVLAILASHVAEEEAGEAAEAGALALLQGGVEPMDAAEQALSESALKRATIKITGRRVHVRVRARVALPIPGLADRLAGEARADAGP